MLETLNAYKNIIIGVAIVALLMGIYVKGRADGAHATQVRWDADKTSIANVAAKQAADTTAKVISAEKNTEIVTDEYQQRLSRIKDYYSGPGRRIAIGVCNNATANSGAMPTVPSTTKGTHEGAAYQEPARSDNELDTLAASCAETTQQLMSLQDWVKLQHANNP